MNSKLFVVILCLVVSVTATSCSVRGEQPYIGRQISGNQALVMSIENDADLNHLYLPYNGPQTSIGNNPSQLPTPIGTSTGAGSGTVQVGEINLLLRNIGGSASAGRVYISGYDPHMISVESRPGENPIISSGSDSSCVHNVIISTDGQYDVNVFCMPREGLSIGVRDTSAGGGGSAISIGNIPINAWADSVLNSVTGSNVDWFTRNGIFANGRFDCSDIGGGQGCRMSFGSPTGSLNRALHGFLLLNMLYGEINDCRDNCRIFPPNFATGQILMGVTEDYPAGDSLYQTYDLYINRASWPPLVNEMQQRLQVTACYYYTTTITPTVCVDPDPSSRRNDPCDSSQPLVWRGDQGAPIIVSRIQPRSVPGGTMFEIELQHLGTGRFWRPGSLDYCSPYSVGRPDLSREAVVQLLDSRVSGDIFRMRCTPEDTDGNTLVRFQNGRGQLSCFYPLPYSPVQSRQAYLTSLTLEFGYLYQNVITKDVTIHRI